MRHAWKRRVAGAARACLLAALAAVPPGCILPTNTPLRPEALVPSARLEVLPAAGSLHHVRLRDFPGIAVRQQQDLWCWAACASMVLAWEGTPMSQEQLVEAIQGRAPNGQAAEIRAASEHEILLALVPERKAQLDQRWGEWHERLLAKLEEERQAALNGYAAPQAEDELSSGAMFLMGLLAGSVATFSSMDIEDVHFDLQAGQPVVVGLDRPLPEDEADGAATGHAYVLYGLVCTWDPDSDDSESGGYVYHTAELIDPWTGESVSVPVGTLLERVGFMASRGQAERVLELESSLLQ